jgi:two-component system LytT family response regulator
VKPTAVIVDDEPLARQRLRDLLAELDVVDIVGEADDGPEAVALLDRREPDIVLLDIHLPTMSGLQVLARVRHRPAVVFTTAHDSYAVKAFELAAVDYLLKPFGAERLRGALDRAIRDIGGEDEAPGRRAAELATGGPLERLFVRDRGRILTIAARDVEWVEARGDYAALHAGQRVHLMHVALSDLERRLNPSLFFRIHRQYLVNLDHVAAMEPYDAGRLTVTLKTGTRLMASRQRSRLLRAMAR